MGFTAGLVMPSPGEPALPLSERGYRVASGKHGVAVFGTVPLRDVEPMARGWSEQGLDLLDYSVAQAIGACLVATNREGSQAWRLEIEEQARSRSGGDAELEWALGWDRGVSSDAIFIVLSRRPASQGRVHVIGRFPTDCLQGRRRCCPMDADDLGRCVRLLDRMPEWRQRLGEVATRFPEWAPLVERWNDLEAAIREELPEWIGPALRTNGLLDELLAEQGEREGDPPVIDVDQEPGAPANAAAVKRVAERIFSTGMLDAMLEAATEVAGPEQVPGTTTEEGEPFDP